MQGIVDVFDNVVYPDVHINLQKITLVIRT